MSKHTPGPWEVGDKDRNEQPTVMARDWLVAVVPHGCLASMEPEAEANARLIAAAPDLLAALKAVLPYAESRCEGMSESAADLAAQKSVHTDDSARLARKAWAALGVARAAIAKAVPK